MRNKGSRKSFRLRSKAATPEIHNNWEISYGDMVTLLLGFFVIFFNIKQDEPSRIQFFIDEFKNHLTHSTAPQTREPQQENILQIFEPIARETKTYPYQSGNKLVIEFPGVSFFEAGEALLSQEGQNALASFAQKAKKFTGQFRFVVRGYTDHKPLGKHPLYKDNLELSAFRSIAAIRFLHKQGIQLSQMRVGGYGESEHMERQLPESIRKQDRKVVVVVEPLDRTEREELAVLPTELKTLCQIDEKNLRRMVCLESHLLLPQEVQWKVRPYKVRAVSSAPPKEKSHWIHNNFLYRFLNEYHDVQNDGGNP